MMTRKDYVKTAEILNNAIEEVRDYHSDNLEVASLCLESLEYVADQFALYFASDNPNFDEDRFYEAVNVHIEIVGA